METAPRLPDQNETRPPEERIAACIGTWIAQEAANSSRKNDRNNYLDDLWVLRRRLSLPHDDLDNWSAQKVHSHHNRLPFWFEGYSLDPTNDEQSAKLLFAFLMRQAGAYRVQCYFQAASQDDYIRRKLAPDVHGIDLQGTASNRLAELQAATRSGQPPVDLQMLSSHMHTAIARERADLPEVCNRARLGLDFGMEDSPGVRLAAAAQAAWLGCAVDAIVYAASIRGGDLSQVPFLEPLSISDVPGLIYPLAIT